MNKDQTGNKCNTSAKSFRNSNDLDKHMDAKHSEKECSYCENMFRSEADLGRHQNECVQNGTMTTVCNKCDKTFTNFAIKKHIDKCDGRQKFDCPECGMICSSDIDV